MPCKSNKLRIKFWILTEVGLKYVYNILLHLGPLEKEQKEVKPLADVTRLTESIHGKGGYNITTDNFFINVLLATLLLQHKTVMVATVRSNSKGLSKQMTKKRP